MGNAFSYLSGVLLNEKMSATERKIGEAKALIKDAAEKLKANEEALKGMADKKSQAAQKAQRSIEYWKNLIAANESKIKELSRGIDAFKDHDPEELEKKFTKEKEQKKHSENFSKMSDEDLQSAADEHQKNVDELSDEDKANIKEDPKHLAIQKELKKRQMQKIELKKVKEKSTETDPQPETTDKAEQDPSKPTENPDNPNLPDPPANMTDGDNANGGKEESPTDEKGWNEYKKKVENEREAAKRKHFSNWQGDKLRSGVDPKKAEEDEKAYDIANKKNISTGFAYNKWRDSVSREKAEKARSEIKVEPKETPQPEPKEDSSKEIPKYKMFGMKHPDDKKTSDSKTTKTSSDDSKYSKVDNDKDWDRVISNLSKNKEDAESNYKSLIDNDGKWKEGVTDEEKASVKEQIAKADAEMKDAEEAHSLYKAGKKISSKKDIPKVKPKTDSEEVSLEVSKEEKPGKTEYKGEDKSHPLNFDNIEDFKQHHREKAESLEHPSKYGDSLKHVKKINKEINDLNDEIELNNKELKDPKLKKEDKEAVKERNKEISKQIKELHNSKKGSEKIINKHEQDLHNNFYEQHSKKKELSDKIDDVVKKYREAEQNGEKERMQKLGADFDELHGQLKQHLGEGPATSKGDEDETFDDSDVEIHDKPDGIESEISDWEDEDTEEGDSYSRALAKTTGYEENKFKKEGTPKKVAKEVAKKTQWLLNRLGSGLHVQDSSISDIVKNNPSRQALVSNYERLSEWRKQRILKKIKKPLEDHLKDMDDAIEDAEREVEKYETKKVLSDVEKNKLKVAKKQLAALHKEQRSAQETYDKIIETGDTEPRKRGVVDIDTEDENDSNDNTVDAEIVNSRRNKKSLKSSDDTETVDAKQISNDESPKSNDSIEYLKKLFSDKSPDENKEDNEEIQSDKDSDEKPIEGIDFKKDDEGKEENFEPEEKLQNAIYAAQGEIERLGSYDSSEAESVIKSLEGAIEMGEKAIKSNQGIGYALKSLKSAYSKSKTIKESFVFLKDRTKTVKLIQESEEVKVDTKIDPSEYLKNMLRG